ncbi:AAA family ATPase [Stenotrophomonas acidaminiphila]|uniref:AAA family ATPase n=1 Tax=Stenotrophomonas acidaminiphila TaxID=128780 RepID=UPI0039BD3FA7
MEVVFHKVARSAYLSGMRQCFTLREDNWDDYSFKTMFRLAFHNAKGEQLDIGEVKIGYHGQEIGWTSEKLPAKFSKLPLEFFSIGQSAEYYEKFRSIPGFEVKWLEALGDLATLPSRRDMAYKQKVFTESLTRTVSEAIIEQQFARIVAGLAALTPYDFEFVRDPSEELSGIKLRFQVVPDSRPPSNIHVLIGRNGVGKTKILNGMIIGALGASHDAESSGRFQVHENSFGRRDGGKYFSGIVSVSFSAFDPFNPPPNEMRRDSGVRYSYIGLKDNVSSGAPPAPRDMDKLAKEFFNSLKTCLSQTKKRSQWLGCISILESDPNFEEMGLARLAKESNLNERVVVPLFRERMSSGHAIVLLTLTRLIESVEEKTLVLIDEPESHLHPPLLSAFTRALSQLLTSENAVAIIATHSPVLLQEVPRRCAWILSRSRLVSDAERPSIETFGENIGVLTREVFKFEVSKSGFHALLAGSVAAGGSFQVIMDEYQGLIGLEGQAILTSMIRSRDGR